MSRRPARAPWAVLLALPGLCGCPATPDKPGDSPDRALAAAVRALIVAQEPDGSWRSRSYGALKDGLSLTPAVLKAITFAPEQAGSAEARRKGAAYLARSAAVLQKAGTGSRGLIYPVYTASAALIVSTREPSPDAGRTRDVWLAELRARQMNASLGWDRSEAAFGAWGYALAPLRKPQRLPPGQPLDADLSSTMFAIGALRVIGVPADDPAIRDALVFVERCQNVDPTGAAPESAFDDGGFFLTPTDPLRNKAGEAGRDGRGRRRFRSYGSATADGIRALIRCGLPPDHPRVSAARRWLERHFSAARHPGDFAPGRELDRDATYYYYAWSAAHAFRALGLGEWQSGGRRVRWADELARELIGRQRADGTWSNDASSSKEDDPLIATTLAAGALGLCRAAMTPDGQSHP